MKKIDFLLEIYKTQIQTMCSMENIAKYSPDDKKDDETEKLYIKQKEITKTEQDIKELFEFSLMSEADKLEERGIAQFEDDRQSNFDRE